MFLSHVRKKWNVTRNQPLNIALSLDSDQHAQVCNLVSVFCERTGVLCVFQRLTGALLDAHTGLGLQQMTSFYISFFFSATRSICFPMNLTLSFKRWNIWHKLKKLFKNFNGCIVYNLINFWKFELQRRLYYNGMCARYHLTEIIKSEMQSSK